MADLRPLEKSEQNEGKDGLKPLWVGFVTGLLLAALSALVQRNEPAHEKRQATQPGPEAAREPAAKAKESKR